MGDLLGSSRFHEQRTDGQWLLGTTRRASRASRATCVGRLDGKLLERQMELPLVAQGAGPAVPGLRVLGAP